MKNILLIHGPNLNLTGKREPGVYGRTTLPMINEEAVLYAQKLGMNCTVFQSNHEGEIIDRIHEAIGKEDVIIINAGAYTHYSYAIRDALSATCLPCIEVHMSNVHAREEFRHKSVISPVCAGVIAGFGKLSYMLAIHAAHDID